MILLEEKDIKPELDIKFIIAVIIVCTVILWLCIPNINKFAQMSLWGNKIQYYIANLTGENTEEYLFHRNNAVYLAKMSKQNKDAISEMNKAIETLPNFANDIELNKLYKDRGCINLYLGNHKDALSDYIRSKEISFSDYLTVALLFQEINKYNYAQSYCNAILYTDSSAFSGYACLAYLYEKAGQPQTAIKVWDVAISRGQNKAKSYANKARILKDLGYIRDYEKNMKKAEELNSKINLEHSIIENTLNPPILTLSPRSK